MMKTTILTLLILTLAVSGFAQLSDEARIQENSSKYGMGLKPAPTPFSLIDLSRVRWSNSYSVSFFSGGSYSGSSGLLNSTLFYEFSEKLSMTVNVGVYHNLSSLTSDNQSTDARILPGFNLDYHTDKFHLSIGMQTFYGNQLPYYYNPGNYWYPGYFGYYGRR